MKKLISAILVFSLFFSLFATVCSAEEIRGFPTNFPAVTIEELLELIETEDGETFLSWAYEDSEDPDTTKLRPGHRTIIPFYRERGHLLECYFPEESMFHRESIRLGSDKSGPGIFYYFSYSLSGSYDPVNSGSFNITVEPIEEEYASVLESEGLQAYLKKIGYSALQYKEEVTASIGSGETITYFKYTNNSSSYFLIYFIYNGELVQISPLNEKYVSDIISQLHLKVHPIEKKPLNPGYGKFLQARYSVNNGVVYFDVPEMASQEILRENIFQCLNYPFYNDFKIELVNEVYVPAVGGTPQDPNGGTSGSYSYQIKITDSADRSFTTRTFTKIIKQSKFIGFDQLKAEGNKLSVNVVQYAPTYHEISFAYYRDNLFLGRKSKYTCWDGLVTTETFTEEIPEEANRVKIFLWGSATYKETSARSSEISIHLKPLCPAMEITKNEQGEWEQS